MLDRIKKAVLWVVTPLAFIAGFIFYLLTQNRALKAKIDSQERSERIDRFTGEAKDAEEKAEGAADDYRAVRDRYLREHPGGDDVSGSNTGVRSGDRREGSGDPETESGPHGNA